MRKSNRENRLVQHWVCPHCGTNITARTFRLSPADAGQTVCPAPGCGHTFAWKSQNKGKLWPEQRAYNVLR